MPVGPKNNEEFLSDLTERKDA